MSAESHAKNAPKCRKAFAQMAMLVAWQEKTSFAKSATAPTLKALNFALNAASFPVKPPSRGPLASVTASTSLENPNR